MQRFELVRRNVLVKLELTSLVQSLLVERLLLGERDSSGGVELVQQRSRVQI